MAINKKKQLLDRIDSLVDGFLREINYQRTLITDDADYIKMLNKVSTQVGFVKHDTVHYRQTRKQ